MQLCINSATTLTARFEELVPAYAAAGFKAAELWFNQVDPYSSKHGLAATRRLLDEHGLHAVGMIGIREYLLGARVWPLPLALAHLERRLSECQALGAIHLNMEPLPSPISVPSDAFQIAVERLTLAAELAHRYGITLGLEFIRGVLFNNNLDTALRLVQAVNHPNLTVLFDPCHFWMGGSRWEDLDGVDASRFVLMHMDDGRDAPRELFLDSDRVLLGEGVFPLLRILDTLTARGFDGYVSLELFNPDYWAMPVEEAARRAYQNMSSYLRPWLER